MITILQWTGWLGYLDSVLNPLMRLISLPPEAAVPIVTGMAVNLYAAIAAMTALSFSTPQMTLIAVFTLIAHNLILEGVVQHKSGLHVIKATFIRITVAILTVIIIARFLGDTSQSLASPVEITLRAPLLDILKGWGINTLVLLLKILGIVMGIMVLLEFSRELKWAEHALRFAHPLMKILRLSERTALLWLTSATFGLMYGGAVIVGEAKKGTLTKEELARLHISMGINHAMIEDPALFLALGLNPFWLWVPKLVMAIIAVQIYRTCRYLKHKLTG